MGRGICAGARTGDVDFPEARGDRGMHPPDTAPPSIPRRMRLTREMFDRFGLTAQRLGCRAIRTGEGYPAKHTERCRPRVEPRTREGAWRSFHGCARQGKNGPGTENEPEERELRTQISSETWRKEVRVRRALVTGLEANQ